MRRARVEQARLTRREFLRLASGSVRQAQNGDIGLLQQARAGRRIFAIRLRDREQVYVRTWTQTLCDLESGRTDLTVDEYLCWQGKFSWCQKRRGILRPHCPNYQSLRQNHFKALSASSSTLIGKMMV